MHLIFFCADILEEEVSGADNCIALSCLAAPSTAKYVTEIPSFSHSWNIFFQRFKRRSEVSLLFVPKQAKENAGTPSVRGCAIYISPTSNDFSID